MTGGALKGVVAGLAETLDAKKGSNNKPNSNLVELLCQLTMYPPDRANQSESACFRFALEALSFR